MVLTISGLIPRSKILGTNVTRLSDSAARRGEIAITIDDGPDPDVTPQVLKILGHYQAKATFFCIGKHALQFPELIREIVRLGHSVENHSLTHPWYFSLLDPWSMHREVNGAQLVLSEISGIAPRFFRPTAGLRNPQLEPILACCGLTLCSWSKRGFDSKNGDSEAVLNRLTQDLKAGDILLLHDGGAALTKAGTPVILDVLPRLLENIEQRKLRSVTLTSGITHT